MTAVQDAIDERLSPQECLALNSAFFKLMVFDRGGVLRQAAR